MSKYFSNWKFSDVVKFLRKNDFSHYKTRGSHFQYKKQNKFLVVVQFHKSKSIPVGTIYSIIKQSGIDKKEWKKFKFKKK